MSCLYLYLKSGHEISNNNLKYIFDSIFEKEYQLNWDGTFGRLILEHSETQFVNLKLSFDAIYADLMDDFTAIVVPRFEPMIANLVKGLTRIGLYHFAEELPLILKKEPSLRDILLSFQNEVSPDIMTTIKSYLELNMSVNMVSKTMYTHRNTVNYRIGRFIELTGIDIRSTTNGYYIYLLITWR